VFGEQNWGNDGAMWTQRTPDYYWGSYVCASFGENQSNNATVRFLWQE